MLLWLGSCNEDIPTVSTGLDDIYRIERLQKLPLRPAITGTSCRWIVDGQEVSTGKEYIFIASRPGTYHIEYEITDGGKSFQHQIEVIVLEEEVAYSPYIAEVLEYFPAPGQFVNTMPQYDEGDTYADMLRKCTEAVRETRDELISLGGFGGYVTFRFDHTVMDVAGEPDIRIWGNAFYEYTGGERKAGSAEPGIVMVSFDANCNGLPDDAWYELRGSEHDNPLTIFGYGITYTRPEADKAPAPGGNAFISDPEYIAWTDNRGTTGYIAKNTFHDQSYWPLWVDAEQISFSGTCLPPNGTTVPGIGSSLTCYDWGYADNHPNDQAALNSFDISNAVDALGNRVQLPGVDFIRVYTGVNQYNGRIGETSTEICRAQDLHI